MESEPLLTPQAKITSKRIKDLDDTRPDTIKLLEENTGQTPSAINDSNISDPPPRVMTLKTKTNKWDLIKLKSFCTAKKTLNKTKRLPTEGKKISANEVTDKGLISKLYNHLLQLHTKETNKHHEQKSDGTIKLYNETCKDLKILELPNRKI